MNPLQRGYYKSEPAYLYESMMGVAALFTFFVVSWFRVLPPMITLAYGGAACVLEAITLYRIATYRRRIT